MASKPAGSAAAIALGGMLAALAVVIMCLGTIIPIATYICPMICILLLQVVNISCGSRIAWAWYGAVTILSLLLAPDKEAAAVYAALGYYPIIRNKLEQTRLPILWKGLYFNGSIAALYYLLLKIMGIEQLIREFEGIGLWIILLLMIMGNVTFWLLDGLLGRKILARLRK